MEPTMLRDEHGLTARRIASTQQTESADLRIAAAAMVIDETGSPRRSP
jgi:hypothetical protein